MDLTLREDANAVILPAFAGTTLSEECRKFLDNGGTSILLGESRDEYVARTMSDARRKSESAESFYNVIAESKSLSGHLLAAVDQEIGGIERLHDLVPRFPSAFDITKANAQDIEQLAYDVGRAAAELGVNCFLAPIVDVVTGANPWLNGRTYSSDAAVVSRVSTAYVRGVQKAGIAATAKHFPGFHNIELDPAIDADAMVTEPIESYDQGLMPYRNVIAEKVEIVMMGPAIVQAFDPHKPALRSKVVVEVLKNELGFNGLVMADGLGAKATMRGDSLEQVAIDAITAGCDLLLLADADTRLSDVATALVDSVNRGIIKRETLAHSAAKVRALARKYTDSNQESD